ncbi:unnamed protein product [Closterium sp. NIES-54]
MYRAALQLLALLALARSPAAAHTSRPAAAYESLPSALPSTRRPALQPVPSCPATRASLCPALRPARHPALQLASRAVLPLGPCTALPCSPARRALLPCPMHAPLPCASRPAAARMPRPAARASHLAAARASLPAAPRVAPCCSPRVALCCPARRARLQPARRALKPAHRALLQPSASRPTALPSACPAALHAVLPHLPAPPSRPPATTAAAARATAAAGGGPAGSAGGAAGAGGAGPATDRHWLSWPLSREFAATPGASESAAALGAREPANALGARASTATGLALAEALHTFTLHSGASRCFFCDCTTVTPLATPVSDVWVDTFILGGQRVAICTCSRTGHHLATFTRHLGSGLYTLTTASAQVAESGQVAALSRVSVSDQLAASCSCQVLSHHTLLWHHRLNHPSLLRLRSMHSRLLVSGIPRSLPSLTHSPAPPCLPCVKGRQRAAPHSFEFPPTTAPLQTLHMDIRATRHQLCESFWRDLQDLRLHSDRGGEFSSGLLEEFCRDEGIRQTFTLPASPQKTGIAKRRIGLIMEVARTSMIHVAAPHFLWPFAVRYAVHQLNL